MEIIPFQNDLPSFSEEVTIDGIPYILDFSWNSRGEFWSMSIYNRDQTPLILGVKLVLFFGLINKFVDIGLPPGDIYVVDPSGNTEKLNQNDFETRAYLIYLSENEIESL